MFFFGLRGGNKKSPSQTLNATGVFIYLPLRILTSPMKRSDSTLLMTFLGYVYLLNSPVLKVNRPYIEVEKVLVRAYFTVGYGEGARFLMVFGTPKGRTSGGVCGSFDTGPQKVFGSLGPKGIYRGTQNKHIFMEVW